MAGKPKAMIVAGVMSGTSADGVDVAICRVSPADAGPRVKVLGHYAMRYPTKLRNAVLAAMDAKNTSTAELARLNWRLGEIYADAVEGAVREMKVKPQLIACHGQTIYHQGDAAAFLGRKLAVTWQIGEGAVIAARLELPVVSDFRPADMAAGGKGAPLVPFLDFLLYRDDCAGRIVQNIGGIANLTAIPAGASSKKVTAFDTGPGNMLIDAVTERLFGTPYDRDGRIAGSGAILDRVISDVLRGAFFRRKPPKTAGREEFGREFTREFIRRCGRVDKRDIVATATALTAKSIMDALRRFVLRGTHTYRDFVVSGGGASNPTLMAMLANELLPLGLTIRSSDEFGLPSEAKEAAAFALLAFQTWNRRPSNVPSATGAKGPAILGKISYA